MLIKNCFICGTEYDVNADDICPYCNWWYMGFEQKLIDMGDDYSEENSMTITEARNNYAKGLNIWGEPLPKVRPKMNKD
ncbi:MAG: hypothetical protein IJ515_01725 [Clostridia bacterium]|nr:hypothetical protein [Clostridia bacterium]